MAFSAKKTESVVSLQCHSKDFKLTFTARYGIDREEEMEVDSEPVVEIPHEVTLEVSDFRGASSSKSVHYKCSSIECDVTGKVGFLKDFVKSPEDFMKIISLISLHALGKDTKVVEIPHKVKLEVSDFRGADFSKSVQYECSSIERDVTGKVGFLKEFVKSPEDFMKIITLISLHALGKDTKGPHLCPGMEVLLVRKDYAGREAVTHKKKSDLAGYMITLHECQQIHNFVYQGNFQLTSVLWLLSEFARTVL